MRRDDVDDLPAVSAREGGALLTVDGLGKELIIFFASASVRRFLMTEGRGGVSLARRHVSTS